MPDQGQTDLATSRRRLLAAIAGGIAAVSGLFVVVVSLVLCANYIQLTRTDPASDRVVQPLRATLQNQPQNQVLRDQIRQLDLLARRALFSSLALERQGAYLLLGSAVLMLIALHSNSVLRKQLPQPASSGSDNFVEMNMLARWSVAGLCALVAIAGVILMLLTRREIAQLFPPGLATRPAPGPVAAPVVLRPDPAVLQPTTNVVAAPAVPAVVLPPPSRAAVLSNWPNFRGPDNLGIAYCRTAPTQWDGISGSGILWKAVLPRQGHSSPIVWGSSVFITGGDETGLEVFCLDASTGALAWRSRLEGTPRKIENLNEDNSYASSTPATDGNYVCAIFATGDLVCLRPDGTRLWIRALGVPSINYGYAASLIIWRDRLIVQRDAGQTGMLLALNTATGETLWETRRSVRSSWATPALVPCEDRVQAVLSAAPLLAGYDTESGKELWRIACMMGEIAPSPAYAAGIVFAAQEGCGIKAVALGSTNVLWEASDDVPDVASPLALTNLVLMATSSSALITCFDGPTSTIVWQHEFPKGFYSSPVYAAGNVYATDRDGMTRIFKAARSFELVAEPALGEPVVCTPAITEGRVFIRGTNHLFCIGSK